jgi:proteasome accessory factor B
MNISRVSRLLQLVTLLQTGKGHNVNSLSQECGVSRRTIFRDLEAIREAGLPLDFNPEFQVYRLRQQLSLPPMQFTAEEALATIVLCGELRHKERFPFPDAATSAARKLESVLPLKLREHLRDAGDAIEMLSRPTSPLRKHGTTYQQLVESISKRQSVRIKYESATEKELLSTKLSPYRIVFSRHSWYVIGRSSIHRAVRTFHVGRIASLENTGDKFTIPAGFRLAKFLRNAWNLIPEEGPDNEVHLHFSALVARNVADVIWHRTQRVEFRDDGSLDFHATVSGLNEISWWILGYGDQVTVISPTKLNDMLKQRVERMHEKYNGRA